VRLASFCFGFRLSSALTAGSYLMLARWLAGRLQRSLEWATRPPVSSLEFIPFSFQVQTTTATRLGGRLALLLALFFH
jgi:hypothetical protein